MSLKREEFVCDQDKGLQAQDPHKCVYQWRLRSWWAASGTTCSPEQVMQHTGYSFCSPVRWRDCFHGGLMLVNIFSLWDHFSAWVTALAWFEICFILSAENNDLQAGNGSCFVCKLQKTYLSYKVSKPKLLKLFWQSQLVSVCQWGGRYVQNQLKIALWWVKANRDPLVGLKSPQHILDWLSLHWGTIISPPDKDSVTLTCSNNTDKQQSDKDMICFLNALTNIIIE